MISGSRFNIAQALADGVESGAAVAAAFICDGDPIFSAMPDKLFIRWSVATVPFEMLGDKYSGAECSKFFGH